MASFPSENNEMMFQFLFDEFPPFDEFLTATSAPSPILHHNHHHQQQLEVNGSGFRRVSSVHPSDLSFHDFARSDPSSSGSSSLSGKISPDSPQSTLRRSSAAAAADHEMAIFGELHLLDQCLHSMHVRSDETGFGSNPSPYPLLTLPRQRQHPHPRSLYASKCILPRTAVLYPNRLPGCPDPVLPDPYGQYRTLQYEEPPTLLRNIKYERLMKIDGCIYRMAKDQNGCRFLQKKFADGTEKEVDAIFNGLIVHVVELMVNPFGNYLVQKLLDVCTEEQRLRVVLVVTRDRLELLSICLNNHGTRAVQKLIETLKTRQQVELVVAALKPSFLDLIKDLNGNHVIQRCLQCLPNDDNKFIFDAAAKHCVDIATHQHGCCVLQGCIGHSTGEHRTKLVGEISANGLDLAQHAFGNYVVQYTLDLKDPSATAKFVSQFQGNYVNLSMQKFSSNVVEKCLKLFVDNNQAKIVLELLSAPRFSQLLQDPYANYVIQCALTTTKGSLHSALLGAIKPHLSILRTNPHSKKIYSLVMVMLKK